MANTIIDPTEEIAGNPNAALTTAAELITESKQQTQGTQTTTTTQSTFEIPAKFKGKSQEEIIKAYMNLEAHSGRLANDLGQTRQSVDQLLQQKREQDLRSSGAQNVQRLPEAKELTAADLLQNPTEALNSYLEARESAATKELKERLARQEAQMAQQQFVGRHPDWQQETNDPEFVNWARQTPYRQNLAARAAAEDLAAADALLSEYKAYKPLLTKATSQSTNLEAARKVGLESTSVAGDETKPAGKVIYRRDAQALRISDPDKYDSPAFQNELLKAIAEGRYK
jgi:hypothetical protein